jgi:hypothetical protein
MREVATTLMAVWIVLFLVGVGLGVMDIPGGPRSIGPCDSPMRRYELIFPGILVGCLAREPLVPQHDKTGGKES